MSGVHLGTVFKGAVVTGNSMTGNGVRGAGVFFCQDVTDVIVEGNTITSFHHGCSDEEYATVGKFNIIRNNTFNNITEYVFDFLKSTSSRHGGGLLITGNTIKGLKCPLFAGNYLDDVIISNNNITTVNAESTPSTLIVSNNSNGMIIMGNTLPNDISISQPVDVTNSTNVVDVSNSWN
jgi:hypothetical protein